MGLALVIIFVLFFAGLSLFCFVMSCDPAVFRGDRRLYRILFLISLGITALMLLSMVFNVLRI